MHTLLAALCSIVFLSPSATAQGRRSVSEQPPIQQDGQRKDSQFRDTLRALDREAVQSLLLQLQSAERQRADLGMRPRVDGDVFGFYAGLYGNDRQPTELELRMLAATQRLTISPDGSVLVSPPTDTTDPAVFRLFGQQGEESRPRSMPQTLRTTDPLLPLPAGHTALPAIKDLMVAYKGPSVSSETDAPPWCAAVASQPFATGTSIRGTAFHLGDGWFATANHVLLQCGTTAFVVITDSGSIDAKESFAIAGESIRRNTEFDIAVFTLKRRTVQDLPASSFATCARGDGKSLQVNQGVSIIGYPNGHKDLKRIHNCYIVNPNTSITRLTEACIGEVLLSGNVWKGNSGGPVVDAQNRVVAMVLAYRAKPGADGDYDPSTKAPTAVALSLENAFGAVSIERVLSLLPNSQAQPK